MMRTPSACRLIPTLLVLLLVGLTAVLAAPLLHVRAQPGADDIPYPPQAPWYLPMVSAAESPTETPTPSPTPTAPPTWTGPEGGSIVCLAGDPRDPNVVYAGAWGGGVFRSTDQGLTWSWTSQGLGNYYIDSLAVDPTNSQILYAGTHGGRIFKSTNGGQTWQFAGQTMQPGAVVYSIAVHPADSQLVLAGTRQIGTGLAGPYSGVLYRSLDAGATWQPVLENVGGAGVQDWVYSIAFDPSLPDLVLAATHLNGVLRSTRGGEAGSWSPAAQRDGYNDFSKGRAVAFDPRSTSDAAFYATWHGGFYKSYDHGASFKLTDASLDTVKIYPNGIAIASADPDLMYMASMETASGVLKSTNGGGTWTSAGLKDHDIYSVLAPGESIVFAGTVRDALFKSTNGGRTWFHATEGMVIPQVTGLAAVGSDLFVSTRGSGVHRSTDGGQTWHPYNLDLADLDLVALTKTATNPAGLMAVTATGDLWQTFLVGNSGWSPIGSLAAVDQGWGGCPLADDPRWPLEPADELNLLTAGDAAAASPACTQAGQIILTSTHSETGEPRSWLGSAAGLFSSPDQPGGAQFTPTIRQAVLALAADPNHPGSLVAAGAQGQLWTTRDGGQHWHALPAPGPRVISLASAAGRLYAGTKDGVWYWDDAAWQRFGLDGREVLTLSDQGTAATRLYAGVAGQTFTAQIAETHAAAPPGWVSLPELDGYTISFVSSSTARPGDVFFAVFGRGVLRLSLR